MPAANPHRIDVHHHLFPPAFLAGLIDQDHYLARGPARHWTPEVSLADMDDAGVATAIVSITAPGLDFADGARLARINRECNEYAARMAADRPGRFGFFASLPLPDVDAGLAEIAYALDVLRADGVGLLTSYRDRWLGDAVFAPVMDELERRRAVAYVHPTTPHCCRNLLPGIPDWVIEFPVDTTRTIASLLFSGTVARCPNVRFVFAHVGGILPLVDSHLERAAEVDAALAAQVPGGVPAALRRFHYDTALRAHPTGLSSAVRAVGVSQLLFGTDAPLRKSRAQVEGLQAHAAAAGLTGADLLAIDCGNARRLLARG
jgi:predicted TIM-barrel fold metal-dependent hydrolase